MKTIILSAVLILSTAAHAKTDIEAKKSQLRTNLENSRDNLQQFENNLKITERNLSEVERAVKILQSQSKEIAQQKSKGAQNQQSALQLQAKIEKWIGEEKQLISQEKLMEAELKAKLQAVQNSIAARTENIKSYESKSANLSNSKNDLKNKDQIANELVTEISSSITSAEGEKRTLLEKKSSYQTEITKWRKLVKDSESEYVNFNKIDKE